MISLVGAGSFVGAGTLVAGVAGVGVTVGQTQASATNKITKANNFRFRGFMIRFSSSLLFEFMQGYSKNKQYGSTLVTLTAQYNVENGC